MPGRVDAPGAGIDAASGAATGTPQPLALRLADRLEFATALDPARNYCLWDYSPAAPAEDKFRSINLLLQSFDHAALDPRGHAIVDAIRQAIGGFRTVYGVKQADGRLAWEFYFYDYARQQREVSATQVLRAIAPWMPCKVVIDEQLPYFMFSLDLDHALAGGRRALDVVHLYIGNPGSAVSSGIAYGARATGCTLENFYFFFDAATQLDLAADKIACSAHMDTARVAINEVLLHLFLGCECRSADALPATAELSASRARFRGVAPPAAGPPVVRRRLRLPRQRRPAAGAEERLLRRVLSIAPGALACAAQVRSQVCRYVPKSIGA